MPPTRPATSRRGLLRAGGTAAWAVPAITVVTSAPALAVSPTGVVRIAKGTSYVDDTAYCVVHLQGFTITPGKAIQAGDLHLTVTFDAAGNGPDRFFLLDPGACPAGWTLVGDPDGTVTVLTFVYGGAATATAPIAFTPNQGANDDFFDADTQAGTFTFTATVPGLAAASALLVSPGPAAGLARLSPRRGS